MVRGPRLDKCTKRSGLTICRVKESELDVKVLVEYTITAINVEGSVLYRAEKGIEGWTISLLNDPETLKSKDQYVDSLREIL